MKNKNLIWVYPLSNWVSNFNKTFVYGYCNPMAKLYVSVNKTKEERVKIFPNGNFAQMIKLPNKKNTVTLIQVLGNKKKSISRNVIFTSLRGAKRRSNLTGVKKVMRLISQPFRFPHHDMVIVIDPGHGGKEHGTHSPKGVPEKVYNLQVAKLLFQILKKKYENVYLTRTSDKFLSLKERVEFAKKKRCNLFISIHHNALPDNENPLKHRGVGIYYSHDFAKPFAKKLLESVSKESGLRKYGVFKRDFAVTRPDFYAGILIECGFLIHPEEGGMITKRKTQEKIVNGICNFILSENF